MAGCGTISLAKLIRSHRRIGLDEARAVADLQTRFDTKYLMSEAAFAGFLGRFADRFTVLDVAGRLMFDYENLYFDTRDLKTYRAHLQRRRRRFKIRTRSYECGATMLEVKVKDGRARTVKHRSVHRAGARSHLDRNARHFIAGVLDGQYGMAPPQELHPAVSTRYRRVTLIDPEAGERITLDQRLQVGKGGCVVHFDPGMLILEAKSAHPVGQVNRLLWEHGIRPIRVSKQAIGVATFYPDQPNNLWRPALRRIQPCGVELLEAEPIAHSAAVKPQALVGLQTRVGHASGVAVAGIGLD